MDPDADLASVAALMADRHRAQMLLTLLGGTPQSGSALAGCSAGAMALTGWVPSMRAPERCEWGTSCS